MFKKCYYDKRNSRIHLWHNKDGQDKYDVIKWVPYIFVPTAKSDITTIDGKPVAKMEFNSYWDYNTFLKQPNTHIFENNVKEEIQFLCEVYHHIPDDDIIPPLLNKYFIDIEVHSEDKFPKPEHADYPIVLISVYSSYEDKLYTWGIKEYTGSESRINFIYCKTEEDLVLKFLTFMNTKSPDVLSGWFINKFDIPYIANRCKKLFPDANRMSLISPVNEFREWERNDQYKFDIPGVDVLDYYEVYKKFTFNRLPNFKLDTVAKKELGKGKLEYEATNLRKLYHEDWNTYVEYNAIDVIRVKQIDDKCKYIELVQSLSLLSKCPMKYYEAVTSIIEGTFLTYYRRHNMCAPFLAGGQAVPFEAAYVKDPQVGIHKLVAGFDIASSYPTAMVTLNMGNETFYGAIHYLTEDQIINYNRKREYEDFKLYRNGKMLDISGKALETFNKALKQGLFAIAPNGAIFTTMKEGIIASVERYLFSKKDELGYTISAEKDKEKINQLKSQRNAYKVVLNSIYGALSVPYYRGYNQFIASAITAVGRHSIKNGERFANDWMRDKTKTNDDYVIYIDTDSLYIDFFRYTGEATKEEILKLGSELNEYINRRSFEETQLIDYCSQEKEFKCTFAFELLANSALFLAKKKYGCWLCWKDGKDVDDYKITGLDIVKSDCPEQIRAALKEVLGTVLKASPDSEIREIIKKTEEVFKSSSPNDIAKNINCNNIYQYIDKNGEPVKGTPNHIKGVIYYNKLTKILGIENNYPAIEESSKAKVVYLKKNKFGFDTMTFIEWPHEFNNLISIDTNKMMQKLFINKIEEYLAPIGKVSLLSDTDEQINLFF